MKEVFIGILAGIIGGLGMGGGTVLILFLTIFNNIDQHVAQGANVIFFIPMAIAAILVFIKNKNIKFKIGLSICIWGIIGTAIGAMLSSKLPVAILRKCFGFFLILIAIYQIYSFYKRYRKEKNRDNTNK